ncbi:MAG: PqqD family protein [Acidobacteriota bacterium]
MQVSVTGKPQRLDSVIINDDSEAPSLLNPMTGEIFVTNPVGQHIFQLADGARTLEEVVDAVATQFDGASKDVIRNDAMAFIDNAINRGLVTWQD